MDDTNPELESFRRQWRAEVTARSKGNEGGPSVGPASYSRSGETGHARRRSAVQPPNAARRSVDEEEDLDPKAYHDLDNKEDAFRLGVEGDGSRARDIAVKGDTEPRSALEHFEKAIEREDRGSLGESLSHYRKAYRLDPSIDKTYRAKHYPPSKALQVSSSSSNPANVNPSNASVTVPNTAHHSQDGTLEAPTTTAALILSFGDLPIPASPPPTEASPAPYSPLASLPSEILIEILLSLAVADIAAFTRLSLVCKRLAFLVLTEDRRIWRRIVSGPEFGLGGMHFAYGSTIPIGRPATLDICSLSLNPTPDPHFTPPTHLPLTLCPPTYPSYHHLFRHHPRIRFSGLYISTVNYVRPGAASPAQVTWNTPVHIVTYYRYLRFFRDGSLLSLLTTAEPADVVHHLTPENCATAVSGAGAGLPAIAAVKGALRGRWRIVGDPRVLPAGATPAKDENTDAAAEEPGDVFIETEGSSPKYTYKMHLALRPTGKKRGGGGKLVWRGFWSYNHLTDDWGEFGLRNDRAFFWSRVRSYGLGA